MYFLFVKNGNLVDACGFPLRENLNISAAIDEGLDIIKENEDSKDGWSEVETEDDIANKEKAETLKAIIPLILGIISGNISVTAIEDENTDKRITEVTETTIQPVPRRWSMQ